MNFKQISFDGVDYIAPSWEEMGKLVFEVFRKIDGEGRNYNRVVALAKGGWTWARTLVDFMGVEELDSVRIKFYSGIEEKFDEPRIVVPLPANVGGETVLIFDDVADSGKTLIKAKQHLLEKGAKEVLAATLFYKPESQIEPEYYGYKTSAWVIFPHEIREFIEQTYSNWKEKGIELDDIKKRYLEIGLPSEQVDYFLEKISREV